MNKIINLFVVTAALLCASFTQAQWSYELLDAGPMSDAPGAPFVGASSSSHEPGYEPGELAILGKADGYAVIVVWDKYFTGDADKDIQVRFRFDDEPATTWAWIKMSRGNRSGVLIGDKAGVARTVARIRSAKNRIVVQVRDPADGETIWFEFAKGNLEIQMRRLDAAAQ